MVENAIPKEKGPMPLVQIVKLLLEKVIAASSLNDVIAETFEASVYILVLSRLKGLFERPYQSLNQENLSDESPQLSNQRSALESRFKRLSKLVGDIADVTELRKKAALATDITTIGYLSILAEVNIQRLLCQVLGEPLITVVAHMYINQKLESLAPKSSLVLDRICEKFADLLFWSGVPKDRKELNISITKWVLGSSGGTRQERAEFLEDRFRNRNTAPAVIVLAEILFKSKDPTASKHRSTSASKAVSLGPSTLLDDMESDYRDFLAVFKFLEVIEKFTKVESIESIKSRNLAFYLGMQMIVSKNDPELLTKIVEELEKFEYTKPWWPEKEYSEDQEPAKGP
jgi:hypothetical protein